MNYDDNVHSLYRQGKHSTGKDLGSIRLLRPLKVHLHQRNKTAKEYLMGNRLAFVPTYFQGKITVAKFEGQM